MTVSRFSPNRSRGRQGMTLLEVLVAMAVLAIGVVAALGAVAACVRSNAAAEQYSYGALLAERVAAELDRMDTLQPGDLSGVFDASAPDYSWASQVGSADADGIHPVVITVYWHDQTRKLQLNTSLRPHALPEPPTTGQATTGAATGGGAATRGGGLPSGGGTQRSGTGAAPGSRSGRANS